MILWMFNFVFQLVVNYFHSFPPLKHGIGLWFFTCLRSYVVIKKWDPVEVLSLWPCVMKMCFCRIGKKIKIKIKKSIKLDFIVIEYCVVLEVLILEYNYVFFLGSLPKNSTCGKSSTKCRTWVHRTRVLTQQKSSFTNSSYILFCFVFFFT